jgi:hypothetical protein
MMGMLSKRVVSFILALMFVIAASAWSAGSEIYFRFSIRDGAELARLTRIVSIDDVDGMTVYAYGDASQVSRLEDLGYTCTILPHPGTLIVPDMGTAKDARRQWDVYPTYTGYLDLMSQFAAAHPDVCTIVNVGTTVRGKAILFAKISDNVSVEEDEPEVFYSSSMHGDETTGYVLMLRLIDSLLTAYGTDARITRLVDSCEIWINPLANPDGTYAASDSTVLGATRSNANGADLNRNFPDPDDGPHPDGRSWQPETVAMMTLAQNHSFALSANFHGGVEVVNYPWDTWTRLHVDNTWFIAISRKYADSAQYYGDPSYMNDLNNGITNGAAWYLVSGGRQDYMTYWAGSREVTIEVSAVKLVPAYDLPYYWESNRISLLNYLENALVGVRGVVTDSVTGVPLAATITVLDHDSGLDSSRVFTDPDVGDFHRMIAPGTYNIHFEADGYYPLTVGGTTVLADQSTRLDVSLVPVSQTADLRFQSCDAGLVNPGDQVFLSVTINNVGAADAMGITGTLTTDDIYITVSQAVSSFPDLEKISGVGTSETPFAFTVSATCNHNHRTDFILILTSDGGMVDTAFFTLTIGPVVEDFESESLTYLPWQPAGAAGWQITDVDPFDGLFSARSGSIGNQQNSDLSITVTIDTAGTVSFRYRISSEPGHDFLIFLMDNTPIDAWSGDAGWADAAIAVPAGLHAFTWRYIKDESSSAGADASWIDRVIFPRLQTTPPDITTTRLPDGAADTYYSRQLQSTGGFGRQTWWNKGGDLAGTGLVLSPDGYLEGTVPDTITIVFTAAVQDVVDAADERSVTVRFVHGYACGDANADGIANVGDAVYIINYVFKSGAAPTPPDAGDANCDAAANVGDAVYLVNYIFRDGPPPCCP